MVAATAGATIPADQFKHHWRVGPPAEGDDDQAEPENLIPANDGIEIFAGLHGLDVEVTRDG